jgi:hypothetical protein
MTMPEAALHEHDGSKLRKYQVGPSRQFLYVQPKPKAGAVHSFPNVDFRLRVATTNSCHHPGSRRPVNNVCQLVPDSTHHVVCAVSNFQLK